MAYTLSNTEGLHFAILETTILERLDERLDIWARGVHDKFGPLGGRLRHDNDQFFETFSPSFVATGDEFALTAKFFNPYRATSNHSWNYGFMLGMIGRSDPFVVVLVTSGGEWMTAKRVSGEWVYTNIGLVSQLQLGSNAANTLTVHVDGPYGWFYVNGVRVQDLLGLPMPVYGSGLDLGGEGLRSHEGRVGLLTGFFTGSERSGYSTRFRDFYGLTYSHSGEVEDLGLMEEAVEIEKMRE